MDPDCRSSPDDVTWVNEPVDSGDRSRRVAASSESGQRGRLVETSPADPTIRIVEERDAAGPCVRGPRRNPGDLRRGHPRNPDRKAGSGTDGPGSRDRTLSPEPGRLPMCEGSIVSENEARAELLSALQALSEVILEMRTGQLMAAVGELCADLHGRGLWDASDLELLEAVWQFRRNYEAALLPSREDARP